MRTTSSYSSSMMARCLVLPVLVLILVACGDDKQSQLRRHVEGFCSDLASSLRQMKDGVNASDEEQPIDAGSKESTHPFADSDVRRERAADLHRRFGFCLAVRKADDPTKARIEKSYVEPLATLRGNVVGPAPSAKVALQALEDLERTAREIDALPLRD
jgi:hypothetical protein